MIEKPKTAEERAAEAYAIDLYGTAKHFSLQRLRSEKDFIAGRREG